MSGNAGAGRGRRGAPARLALLLLPLLGAPPSAAQDPARSSPIAVSSGHVVAVAWRGQEGLALALAERAENAAAFPGIGPLPRRPVRLLLAPTRAIYDSLTRGRLPNWSDGAAFPDLGTVVLLTNRPTVQLSTALRHELAHLALRWHAGRRLPLWFEEGYAALAAGEWGRVDALRLNWQLARGVRMNLDEVDGALRGARSADAQAGYALATTAVQLLHRWGGPRGLDPLLARVPAEPSFDAAIRATYYLTADEFEGRWQRDLGSRYGWLTWITAAGTFWTAIGLVLVALMVLRRRRDRERRKQLLDDVEITP